MAIDRNQLASKFGDILVALESAQQSEAEKKDAALRQEIANSKQELAQTKSEFTALKAEMQKTLQGFRSEVKATTKQEIQQSIQQIHKEVQSAQQQAQLAQQEAKKASEERIKMQDIHANAVSAAENRILDLQKKFETKHTESIAALQSQTKSGDARLNKVEAKLKGVAGILKE